MNRIIVIGASAGGVQAILALLRELPADFGSAIFVVLHLPEHAKTLLPDILTRACPIPAKQVENGERIHPGITYVAEPGCHMLVKRGYVRSVFGPRENGHRPAIDPLFRSAAESYGSKVVGVLLTGMLDDGVAGLAAIKEAGGTVLVQDPDEADYPSMPRNALLHVNVDGVLELKDLSQQLINLDRPAAEVIDLLPSKDPVEQSVEELRSLQVEGSPSIFTCPECHGTLFEVHRNGFTHYRCRVGHSYNPAALSTEQVHKTEAALWEGLKLLEENLSLSKRILSRLSEAGHQKSEKLYEKRIRDTEERIALLQEVLRVGLAPGLEASEDAV